jgi:hypothetical protein
MQQAHLLLGTVAHAAATTEAFGPTKNITNTVQQSGSCCTFKSGRQAHVSLPAHFCPLCWQEHEPADSETPDMGKGMRSLPQMP